eukprot:15455533-Alexandrium_andersonii.AAC.1
MLFNRSSLSCAGGVPSVRPCDLPCQLRGLVGQHAGQRARRCVRLIPERRRADGTPKQRRVARKRHEAVRSEGQTTRAAHSGSGEGQTGSQSSAGTI